MSRLCRAALPDHEATPSAVGVLASIEALSGVLMVAFAVARSWRGDPVVAGIEYAVAALLLAAVTVALVPRIGLCALHASLVSAWLIAALLTYDVPSAAGQVLCGMGTMILALYAAFYVSGLGLALQVGGMSAAYVIAIVSAHRVDGFLYALTVAGFICGAAYAVSRLVSRERLAHAAWRLAAQQAEEALALAERERRLVGATVDAVPDPHVLAELQFGGSAPALVCAFSNEAAARFLAPDGRVAVGRPLGELLRGCERDSLHDSLVRAALGGGTLAVDEVPWRDENGQTVAWYDIRATAVSGALAITWRDVTQWFLATQALAESEEQFRRIAENSTDVVMAVRNGSVLWVSPALTDMLGWRPEDWIGRQVRSFTHPDDLGQLVESEFEQGRIQLIRRWRMRSITGEYHWIEAHAKEAIEEHAADWHVVSFRTVDDDIAAENELERRARFDDLTGLLNRSEIVDLLATATPILPRTGTQTAVLFCDLDRFKPVNDTYGHPAGDAVLRTVAQRIRKTIRTNDVAARIGGDEFMILLRGVRDDENARAIADKIRAAVAQPIDISGIAVTITASIGVAMVSGQESTASLIARADRAMYEAKASGRDKTATAV